MNFQNLNLTPDEEELIRTTLDEYRKEKMREEAILAHREQLFDLTIATVDAIGIRETKNILRDILSDLRRENTDHD